MSSHYHFPPPVSATEATGPGQLIMIVDDEESVALLAGSVLEHEGYRVITARNGFQALELFRKLQSELRLVILDFVMPVLGGGEVLNEMRKLNPAVPVLLTSGFTSDAGLRQLLSKGLCPFIPKPLAQKKLLLSVRAAIEGSPIEEPAPSARAAV